MKTLLSVMTAVLLVLSTTAASAEEYVPPEERPTMTSLLGGRTFGVRREYAARAEVGWPGLKLTYIVPFTSDLDISPQLGMIYGRNLRSDLLGFEPGVEIRLNLVTEGHLSVAFYANPALLAWIPSNGDDGTLGFRLGGPGLVGSWQLASKVSAFGGIKVPAAVIFTKRPEIRIPTLAEGGVEVELFQSDEVAVNFNGILTGGPEFCLNQCENDVEAHVRIELGGSVIW